MSRFKAGLLPFVPLIPFHLVMKGVDLETVADLLGHSTVRMTERYAHLSPRHRSRAIAVLDSANRTDTKSDTVEIPATGQSS